MFLSNRGSFRPETSGAYTLRRRGRRRPKSGSAIGACAVARLAGSGGPIGDYYGSANKVYLSPAVDLFDGDVAAFSVGTSPSKALVAEMLAGAVAAAGGGFTLHSDRGWHYRTPDWVRACGEAGVERSMSRKGHSPDNAACEGFFGRLKVEFFHGRDWRGVSAERFAAELAEWIRWYREGRLKAFDEGGRKVYDTIAGRRRRLGLAA